jgi:hypothetical protein
LAFIVVSGDGWEAFQRQRVLIDSNSSNFQSYDRVP